MPSFTIQAPDGRHIDIQAADQATAIKGAQQWAAANPPATKPNALQIIMSGLSDVPHEIGDQVSAAEAQFGRDAASNAAPPTSTGDAIRKAAANAGPLGIPANLGMDALGVIGAPVSAFWKSTVGRPVAAVADAVNDRYHVMPGQVADPQQIGNFASLAVPMTGALAAANDTSALAKAAGMSTAGYSQMAAATRAARPAAAGFVNSLPAGPGSDFAPPTMAMKVKQFDRAGVDPTLAAVGPPGSSQVAKFSAEDPFVGGVPAARLRTSIAQTGQAASGLADEYGAPSSRATAGETIQSGADRFANAQVPATVTSPTQRTSFAAKASALYDRAFSGLNAAMAGKTEPPVKQPVFGTGMLSGTQMGEATSGGSQITTPATTAALAEMTSPAQAESLNSLLTDPTIAKTAQALQSGQGSLSFNDLRQLRTWVRTAKSNTDLRQTIGDANLGKLESSLTADIYQNAGTLGSPALLKQLQRADQFYAAGQSRISNALNSAFKANSGEAAYDQVIGAAQDGGRADIQRLLSVKRSLQPGEWGDVAATALQRLGVPTPGATQIANGADPFSVSSFVTNYAKLSPRGRDILFGSTGGGGAKATGLRDALDNLASVADMQKNVERAANVSKTAIGGRALATVAGVTNHVTFLPTVLSLGGIRGLGEAMTNPSFARWLAVLSKASPATAPAQIAQLDNLATTYPVVAVVAPELKRQLQGGLPQAPN